MAGTDERSAEIDARLGRRVLTAVAHNTEGIAGEAWVDDGLRVRTSAPTAPDDPGTNPEELLALAWATCLNAAARVVAPGVETSVRTEISLHERTVDTAFEFTARAEIAFPGLPPEEAEALAAAADERCPISRLMRGESRAIAVAAHADPAPPAA